MIESNKHDRTGCRIVRSFRLVAIYLVFRTRQSQTSYFAPGLVVSL